MVMVNLGRLKQAVRYCGHSNLNLGAWQTGWPSRRWVQADARGRQEARTKRPPVVTIMGHVDHGKTTLLDHLRNSRIVEQEFGGITQHIGAFVVPFVQANKRSELVTFLDTPGHAAFAAMRQRGANVTDIVVLVVACEDGVMDQTAESIRFAKESNVPIIVAANKIDKFPDERELSRKIELLRSQLVAHDVVTEADGGEVQLVRMSAVKGVGVDELKEAILALAETLELHGRLDCPVRGRVIESQVDPHRGKLCTVLVQRGRLTKGNYLVAGSRNWCRVRALFDERARLKQSCEPGLPVQVTGWREDDPPQAGDPIEQVASEQEAKRIVSEFKAGLAHQKALEDSRAVSQAHLDFQRIYKEGSNKTKYGRTFVTPRGIRPKEYQENPLADRAINLVLKCDTHGSLDALLHLLDSYDPDNGQPVKLDLMHHGVGAITENDYQLAAAFKNSLIYGFNVRPADQRLLLTARQNQVDIKLFNVIYHLVDDLKSRISEKLPEIEDELELGQATVIQEFVVTEPNKRRTHVAGCRCTRGVLKRDALYRLMRNSQLVQQAMPVKTLKHLKLDVKEIEKERECGISFEGFETLEFRPGDVLVAYEKRKRKQKLKWNLKGF